MERDAPSVGLGSSTLKSTLRNAPQRCDFREEYRPHRQRMARQSGLMMQPGCVSRSSALSIPTTASCCLTLTISMPWLVAKAASISGYLPALINCPAKPRPLSSQKHSDAAMTQRNSFGWNRVNRWFFVFRALNQKGERASI